MQPQIPIDQAKIEAFCQKWKIVEFSLFGSVLREDFGPDSDVDVLVTFAPRAGWTLFDWVEMAEELEGIFARKVDLMTHRSVKSSENYLLRRAILESEQRIYAA
jgi:predicted nucleotidyltransferase